MVKCSHKECFEVKVENSDFFICMCKVLARNSKCQASQKPLPLSWGWEQYMQAALGGIAALVYYSPRASLGLLWDALMMHLMPAQRHQCSPCWAGWRFHQQGIMDWLQAEEELRVGVCHGGTCSAQLLLSRLLLRQQLCELRLPGLWQRVPEVKRLGWAWSKPFWFGH